MEYLSWNMLESAGACHEGLRVWCDFWGYGDVSSNMVADSIRHIGRVRDAWETYEAWIETHFPMFHEAVIHNMQRDTVIGRAYKVPRERLTKVQSKARKIEWEISKLDMEISELQRIRYALAQSLDVLRD